MPWSMVHTAIAIRFSGYNPSSHLLLGSISPDAIHMRGSVTREEKGVTHFVREGKLPTIEVMENKCLKYLRLNEDREWKDFILGYFAHIYADLRWTDTVYAEFERNYTGEPKMGSFRCEIFQIRKLHYVKKEGEGTYGEHYRNCETLRIVCIDCIQSDKQSSVCI